MKLTNEEFNVVEKISRRSKADCWFELTTDDDDEDVVVDMEEDKIMSLEEGLLLLDSGLTELSDYNLTADEEQCYKNLIKKMLVIQQLDRDRFLSLLYNSIILLEDSTMFGKSLKGSELQDELNITDDEYDYIMSETPSDDDFWVDDAETNTPAERHKIEDKNSDAPKN